MDIGICSYSFHRLLATGQQDIFKYITDCKSLGCTLLDPWNGHLPLLLETDRKITPGIDLQNADRLTRPELEYISSIQSAAKAVGLPFGNIAVDGAHVFDPDPKVRAANRARAYRWLDVARRLEARQIRIDAGGPESLPDDAFRLIVEGYNDLIARAKPDGIEVVIENHWGSSGIPANVIRILEAVPELGLLYDTFNWKPEFRAEGRRTTARYATSTHIKTLVWDDAGNETDQDLSTAIGYLKQAGYKGPWGIESTPRDGDEMKSVRNSVALIRRLVA